MPDVSVKITDPGRRGEERGPFRSFYRAWDRTVNRLREGVYPDETVLIAVRPKDASALELQRVEDLAYRIREYCSGAFPGYYVSARPDRDEPGFIVCLEPFQDAGEKAAKIFRDILERSDYA